MINDGNDKNEKKWLRAWCYMWIKEKNKKLEKKIHKEKCTKWKNSTNLGGNN